MTKIDWANVPRLFDVGLDQGVLYVADSPGVPWVGLASVTDSRSVAQYKDYYQEGSKYLHKIEPNDHSMSLSAFMYPEEFEKCDGYLEMTNGFSIDHQEHTEFNLSYRTKVGNELQGSDYGYKIHLVYNVLANASDYINSSIGSQLSLTAMTWSLATRPIKLDGFLPSAHYVINATKLKPKVIEAIESILYGSEDTSPRLPQPNEIFDILKVSSDNGAPNTFTSQFGAFF